MTHFSDKIQSGPQGFGTEARSVGDVGVSQTVTLQAASAANVDGTITVPPNSKILDFLIDSTVLWTATTASLTVGTAAGGAQYVSGFDVKTVTRGPTAAFTAAQLAAMDNVGNNTTIAFRVASTGAHNVGTTKATVRYIPGS
jgi:hypothetical protein